MSVECDLHGTAIHFLSKQHVFHPIDFWWASAQVLCFFPHIWQETETWGAVCKSALVCAYFYFILFCVQQWWRALSIFFLFLLLSTTWMHTCSCICAQPGTHWTAEGDCVTVLFCRAELSFSESWTESNDQFNKKKTWSTWPERWLCKLHCAICACGDRLSKLHTAPLPCSFTTTQVATTAAVLFTSQEHCTWFGSDNHVPIFLLHVLQTKMRRKCQGKPNAYTRTGNGVGVTISQAAHWCNSPTSSTPCFLNWSKNLIEALTCDRTCNKKCAHALKRTLRHERTARQLGDTSTTKPCLNEGGHCVTYVDLCLVSIGIADVEQNAVEVWTERINQTPTSFPSRTSAINLWTQTKDQPAIVRSTASLFSLRGEHE